MGRYKNKSFVYDGVLVGSIRDYMKSNNGNIFIVDDDLDVRDSLRWLFESVGFKVQTYPSAQEFLASSYEKNRGCLIIDVRMPIMSGFELLEVMGSKKNNLPVIMITGYGDIPMAIRAMKSGAVDFVLKPINHQYLLDVVQKSIAESTDFILDDDINERINRLSARERQVVDLILEGRLNKQIAFDLSISISTVEAHRANVMRKMKAKNLAQLIKIYLQAQLHRELA